MTIENVIPTKNCSDKTICLSLLEELMGKTIKNSEILKPSEQRYIDYARVLEIEITIMEEMKK